MSHNTLPAFRSIRRHLVLGIAVVSFVAFAIGGWAATMDIAGAVVAQGNIVVDSSVKKVQHPTGGIVADLRARDGDRVKAGDVLIQLDATQTRAATAIITKSLDELTARQGRLEAEQNGADQITLPVEFTERGRDAAHMIAAEQKLFELRQEARSGKKAQLRERIIQLREEIQGYVGQTAAKGHEIELINKELEGVRELWQKKLVAMNRLTALERDAARIEGERSQLIGAMAQTKGKITETELQIIQIDQDLRSEVSKDLAETQAKISELVERKIAAEDQLKRIDIRAPRSGVVHQLAVHTVGGVIAAGEPIMLVVPDADMLTVEVKVAPQDIDQLYPGQGATLRFSAFNQHTTPEIEGEVSLISADLTQDQRTGVNYYTVRITPTELLRLGELKLVPGMPVDAFIKTGARTMLSYLIKPLRDQAARTFKER